MSNLPEGTKLLFSIPDLMAATSLGRTRIYEEIHAGRLTPVKSGRRTLFPRTEVLAWIERLSKTGGAA